MNYDQLVKAHPEVEHVLGDLRNSVPFAVNRYDTLFESLSSLERKVLSDASRRQRQALRCF